MALAYRSVSIDIILEAIAASAPILARWPHMEPERDDRTSRIRSIILRAPADFPRIRVMTGNSHGGQIFGIQSFADEQGPGILDFSQRNAQLYVDIIWNTNDQDAIADSERDFIEMEILAAIAARGRSDFASCVGMSYGGQQRMAADIAVNGADKPVRAEMSRLTLNALYEIEKVDALPNGFADDE